MLIFDQLRRSDRQLRWLAAGVLLGMFLLFAGLWRVQIISSRKYAENLKDQSYRNVLIAAPRGKILDRNGNVLAENQPRFVVNLYLEDLRNLFYKEYTNTVRKEWLQANPGRKITTAVKGELNKAARYNVVSNIVFQVSSAVLPQPLILIEKNFTKHYTESLALPMEIPLGNLTPDQVGLFMEKAIKIPGVELEVQPMRVYLHKSLAVHVMGFVRQEVLHNDDEGLAFEDKTPVLTGKSGLEETYDNELRGKPGVKSILVNNLGYRQREQVLYPPLAGQDVSVTLDLDFQKAAEDALLKAGPMNGPEVRGAAVIMDVRTGDILATASSPTYDPTLFLSRVPQEVFAELMDPKLRPMINRAFYGSYAPGSTFKIVTGLAGLDAGIINPEELYYHDGYFMLGRRKIKDTAAPGKYNFKEAFKHSSNSYFIDYGLRVGAQRLIALGNQFGFGDRTGMVGTGLEVSGYFPEPGQRFKKNGDPWMEGDTANLCIGQGEITVTPLQLAIMTAAVANGGKVFKPRLVTKIAGGEVELAEKTFPTAEVTHEVQMNPHNLRIVQEAMLADVNEKGGSGEPAKVAGMNICGKTGTAQVKRPLAMGGGMDHVTWFVSYAPFEAPRYAVVVMVEEGASGGSACATKVGYIYEQINKIEQKRAVKVVGVGL